MRQDVRHSDFTLSDDQQAVRGLFAEFFEKESPAALVREAEPLGFDKHLWEKLVAVGGTSMSVPAAAGGDGAGLVELALAAEEYGRTLAPVPLVETAVAARLLARTGVSADWLAAIAAGERLVTIALQPAVGAQLVPGGAVCSNLVGSNGSSLLLVTDQEPGPLVPNHGSAPLAWRELDGDHQQRMQLAEGSRAASLFEGMVAEWKLLTAAALVGLSAGVLDLAVEHAKTRHAFGTPIGAFQGVSHRLADVLIGIEGARRLVWKAAWFADHEPEGSQRLVISAWIHACEVATRAAASCLHVHGGVGFTIDSNVQLYFRRVKGWTALAGDPQRDLQRLVGLAASSFVGRDAFGGERMGG